LIFIEPDRGCTILLAAVSGAMLILAGVRLVFFAPPALAAVAFVVYSILHDPMRMGRIMAWVHPEESKEGVGYQAYQAMIALGSEELTASASAMAVKNLDSCPSITPMLIFSIIGENSA